MSVAISKIIISSITKVIKSTAKFDITIDELLEKFKESCPPKPELLLIVQQKNQIQSALTTIIGTVATLEKTATTTKKIIKGVGTAVTVIKIIPLPTSVPPGVGIPVSIINAFTAGLMALGKVLDSAEGAVSIVPPAAKTIGRSAQSILNKLQLLNQVVDKCAVELIDNIEWNKDITYQEGDVVTYKISNGKPNYYSSLIGSNLNVPPTNLTVPPSWLISTEQEATNQIVGQIQIAASTAGAFENIGVNALGEEALLARLSPNSNDPLLYKGFQLEIQFNNNNTYSFPQRRIFGTGTDELIDIINLTQDSKQADLDPSTITITNLEDGAYSYSNSVQILIDEIKFRIDQYILENPIIIPPIIPPVVPVVIVPPVVPNKSIPTIRGLTGNYVGEVGYLVQFKQLAIFNESLGTEVATTTIKVSKYIWEGPYQGAVVSISGVSNSPQWVFKTETTSTKVENFSVISIPRNANPDNYTRFKTLIFPTIPLSPPLYPLSRALEIIETTPDIQTINTNPNSTKYNRIGSNSGGKIICNELHNQGFLNGKLWDADERYGEMMFKKTPKAIIGYQMWAKYVVKYMRNNPHNTKHLYRIIKPWTEYMGYEMGILDKQNYIGKIMHNIAKPPTYLIFYLGGGKKLLNCITTKKIKI